MKTTKYFISLMLLLVMITSVATAQKMTKQLRAYTKKVATELDQVSPERKETLTEIGDFLLSELKEDDKADIIIICTHNSRRSHISQLWLQTAAEYYGIKGINVFSGGLEATAFHPNAIAALERAGFNISGVQSGDNPVYTASNGITNSIMYSKKYTDTQNPQADFGAIMVCSDADKSCPMVEGADDRFALPFDDPRYYDNTPSVNQKYDETVREIAREMFFLADYVKSKLILKAEAKK